MSEDDVLLDVSDLRVLVPTADGPAAAVDGISFRLRRSEVLALVGESGCGKSLTALALLRLLEEPVRIESGRVLFRGTDLLRLPESAMRRYRGHGLAIVFQEPMSALNPVLTVGEQIDEAVMLHEGRGAREARQRTLRLLSEVGIADAERQAGEYPHRLSGGQRQRALLAMALACDPDILVLDEPTTALDVTVQAQVLDLLARLRRTRSTSMLLITHDLGVVAETADRVAVMYAGRIVERGTVEEVLSRPLHPYTRGLLAAVPSPFERRPPQPIPGQVPTPGRRPTGCSFRPRCAEAEEACASVDPSLVGGSGREVACLVREREGLG